MEKSDFEKKYMCDNFEIYKGFSFKDYPPPQAGISITMFLLLSTPCT